MWLCSGSQHSRERSRGIGILMCIHLERGASHHTCCVSQRLQSTSRAQLPQPRRASPSLHPAPEPNHWTNAEAFSLPHYHHQGQEGGAELSCFTSFLLSSPIQSCVTWVVLPPQSVTRKNRTGTFADTVQDFSSFALCFFGRCYHS